MTSIQFGTDGWRAVMGRDYTHENVSKVIQAFCDVKKNEPVKTVYLGYDRRKDSDQFAKTVAEVLAGNGFTVFLSKSFCPTPCISWLTKTQNALAGIMVTASHNPPQWNGIKFKESYGGSAAPEYTQVIEEQIVKNDTSSNHAKRQNLNDALENGLIRWFDPAATYVAHLKNFVDVASIQKSGVRVVCDPMFGAGSDFFPAVLGEKVLQIHADKDPNFGGTNPEPIEKNLGELMSLLKNRKGDVGLATDGDADRIGAVDESGRYITTHQIFALLLKHHVTHRKNHGSVVMSISTTSLIRKMCAAYGLKLIETPIGFKHICKILKNEDAFMGGEESGGISYRDHVHERDGIFNGLMLLEMMALHKKTLGGLVQDLNREFGEYFYERIDYHLSAEKIATARQLAIKADISEIAGVKVREIQTIDGTKIFFEDDSWLLMRSSGTEPLIRTYAEASSLKRVKDILTFAKSYLQLE